MLVIVIPDVHLKYWLFRQADNLLKHGAADTAVCAELWLGHHRTGNDHDVYLL